MNAASTGANSPTAYNLQLQSTIPDQEVLHIERLPDSVQTDHVNWGFRLAQLWGQDYRYTTSKGIFSQQLLDLFTSTGDDPVMFYVDLHVPHVVKGMNIRMGRYTSLPDIEAHLAPTNYTYSRSLLSTLSTHTRKPASSRASTSTLLPPSSWYRSCCVS